MLPIRVMIVDDHELIRRGIMALLADHPEYEVVAEAGDGVTAVKTARELQPDLVLLDLDLPEMSGLMVIHRIREVSPQTKMVVISQYDSSWVVEAVTSAGACGYVLKSDAAALLLSAMAAVSQQRSFLRGLYPGVSLPSKNDSVS